MTSTKEWFGEWFNSPYYHILYKNHDYKEAQLFIENLVKYLGLKHSDNMMDLACGKGRHAIYLHRLGYNVTGVDLAPQNIEFAKRFSKIFGDERLQFFVHDMRNVFRDNEFDYILNMFTSFGYFEKAGENKQAIKAAASALKKGGKLVIDFFNTNKVICHLQPYEKKIIDGIEFEINKKIKNGFIVKQINFNADGKTYHFEEKVKSISTEDFMKYFESAGLKLVDFFGDYELNPFHAETSERMIFITQK